MNDDPSRAPRPGGGSHPDEGGARRSASPLHPYMGFRDEVTEMLGRPWSKRTFDTDVSGNVEYRFNSLGFRGAEYDPSAEFSVFVFGESDAFGSGVAEDETWPARIAHALAAERGQTLGLMNFSEAAASNPNIARTCLLQCGAVRPDAAIIALADDDRDEGLIGDRPFSVGSWMTGLDIDETVAPLEGEHRVRVEEALRRSRAHRRFDGLHPDGQPGERPNEPNGRLRTLRAVLLMQEFLKARGIPYVIVSRERYRTFGPVTAEHPLLGALLALVDESALSPVATVEVASGAFGGDVGFAADGVHFSSATHARIAELVLEAGSGALAPPRSLDPVSAAVAEFFDELPFNFYSTDEIARRSLSEGDAVTSALPDLARIAAEDGVARALDVGCGAGWLTHTLAGHHGLEVEGIDVCRPALARARRMARHLGTRDRVWLREASVFDLDEEGAFDLTAAMGVLHHTHDPRGALERMVRATREGGYVYLGLYHAPARRVFLDEFRRVLRSEGERSAFALFQSLDPARAEDTQFSRSWFRALLFAPHESQHTIAEVAGWFDALGVELLSTSLNRFEPFEALDELERAEGEAAEAARIALHEERRFLPGFFTVLGRRRPRD